ncbi:hypothetical protein EGW08_003771 [Elysia chlorotica]|uniref:FH2 domain-containing protein n=1 Tax=Elysia chlorotica TaxID=188477 RepID=A0A433U3Y5_ELYCH|nr:hypothetical protein EGW08_003771 [Elysia chlorotica]
MMMLNAGDLKQVVKYLELEAQFSTRPAKQRDVDKKKEILIMDQKKAYNISILLGHLKMSVPEVKRALYSMDEKALAPELLRQLLAFAPSKPEIEQYKAYSGDQSQLTKPDQFAQQMCLVGDYEERLKALLFKSSFKEKTEELRKDLASIKTASIEVKNSKKLSRLLEVILAMGNYLNQGNPRVGEAAGFRIAFLTQFPELLSFSDEILTVDKAAKVSMDGIDQDIQDLKRNLQMTSSTLSKVSDQGQEPGPGDRFQDVMGVSFTIARCSSCNFHPLSLTADQHFVAEATDELQSIFRLHAAAMSQFAQMVAFFGENPKTVTTTEVFRIFSDFIVNFESSIAVEFMVEKIFGIGYLS